MSDLASWIQESTTYYIECDRCGRVTDYHMEECDAVSQAEDLGYKVVGGRVLCEWCIEEADR